MRLLEQSSFQSTPPRGDELRCILALARPQYTPTLLVGPEAWHDSRVQCVACSPSLIHPEALWSDEESLPPLDQTVRSLGQGLTYARGEVSSLAARGNRMLFSRWM